LRIDTANSIPSISGLSLSSGTFNINRYAQILGTISMSANSNIILAPLGLSMLKFSGMDSFSGGTILTINGKQGTYGTPGTTGTAGKKLSIQH